MFVGGFRLWNIFTRVTVNPLFAIKGDPPNLILFNRLSTQNTRQRNPHDTVIAESIDDHRSILSVEPRRKLCDIKTLFTTRPKHLPDHLAFGATQAVILHD